MSNDSSTSDDYIRMSEESLAESQDGSEGYKTREVARAQTYATLAVARALQERSNG